MDAIYQNHIPLGAIVNANIKVFQMYVAIYQNPIPLGAIVKANIKVFQMYVKGHGKGKEV